MGLEATATAQNTKSSQMSPAQQKWDDHLSLLQTNHIYFELKPKHPKYFADIYDSNSSQLPSDPVVLSDLDSSSSTSTTADFTEHGMLSKSFWVERFELAEKGIQNNNLKILCRALGPVSHSSYAYVIESKKNYWQWLQALAHLIVVGAVEKTAFEFLMQQYPVKLKSGDALSNVELDALCNEIDNIKLGGERSIKQFVINKFGQDLFDEIEYYLQVKLNEVQASLKSTAPAAVILLSEIFYNFKKMRETLEKQCQQIETEQQIATIHYGKVDLDDIWQKFEEEVGKIHGRRRDLNLTLLFEIIALRKSGIASQSIENKGVDGKPQEVNTLLNIGMQEHFKRPNEETMAIIRYLLLRGAIPLAGSNNRNFERNWKLIDQVLTLLKMPTPQRDEYLLQMLTYPISDSFELKPRHAEYFPDIIYDNKIAQLPSDVGASNAASSSASDLTSTVSVSEATDIMANSFWAERFDLAKQAIKGCNLHALRQALGPECFTTFAYVKESKANHAQWLQTFAYLIVVIAVEREVSELTKQYLARVRAGESLNTATLVNALCNELDNLKMGGVKSIERVVVDTFGHDIFQKIKEHLKEILTKVQAEFKQFPLNIMFYQLKQLRQTLEEKCELIEKSQQTENVRYQAIDLDDIWQKFQGYSDRQSENGNGSIPALEKTPLRKSGIASQPLENKGRDGQPQEEDTLLNAALQAYDDHPTKRTETTSIIQYLLLRGAIPSAGCNKYLKRQWELINFILTNLDMSPEQREEYRLKMLAYEANDTGFDFKPRHPEYFTDICDIYDNNTSQLPRDATAGLSTSTTISLFVEKNTVQQAFWMERFYRAQQAIDKIDLMALRHALGPESITSFGYVLESKTNHWQWLQALAHLVVVTVVEKTLRDVVTKKYSARLRSRDALSSAEVDVLCNEIDNLKIGGAKSIEKVVVNILGRHIFEKMENDLKTRLNEAQANLKKAIPVNEHLITLQKLRVTLEEKCEKIEMAQQVENTSYHTIELEVVWKNFQADLEKTMGKENSVDLAAEIKALRKSGIASQAIGDKGKDGRPQEKKENKDEQPQGKEGGKDERPQEKKESKDEQPQGKEGGKDKRPSQAKDTLLGLAIQSYADLFEKKEETSAILDIIKYLLLRGAVPSSDCEEDLKKDWKLLNFILLRLNMSTYQREQYRLKMLAYSGKAVETDNVWWMNPWIANYIFDPVIAEKRRDAIAAIIVLSLQSAMTDEQLASKIIKRGNEAPRGLLGNSSFFTEMNRVHQVENAANTAGNVAMIGTELSTKRITALN